MKKKMIVTICTLVSVTVLAAFFYRRRHRRYSVQ